MQFRKLRADEIEVRPKVVKQNGCSLLLFKDARCDMNILDESVGSMNWQRKHLRDNANCVVSIWDKDKNQWISKEDTGTESNTEKEKGQASDSFKRACFNWGIGRELYTAPFIWITSQNYTIKNGKITDRFKVKTINYDGNKISELEIINNDTKKIVFTFKNGQSNSPKSQSPKEEKPKEEEKPTNAQMYEVVKQAVKTGVMSAEEVTTSIKEYKKEKFKDLTYTQARSIYNIAVLRLKNK